MKGNIHPAYKEAKFVCACGNSWQTRSTSAELSIDVCNNCHPHFTGKMKLLDTEGRIDRFKKKYAGKTAAK
jgi:large subunit ribosomal protein L31